MGPAFVHHALALLASAAVFSTWQAEWIGSEVGLVIRPTVGEGDDVVDLIGLRS